MLAAPPVGLHTWTAPAAGAGRNLFAVETEHGLVVVDGPWRRSDGVAARAWLEMLGKPVLAVLLTHAHPDHTFGLTELLGGADVPVHATAAVAEAIAATEETMRQVVRRTLGPEETEEHLRHPDVIVAPGLPVTVDGVAFEVTDVGAAESASDSLWRTPSLPSAVFSGDLIMHRVHLSLVEGRSGRYIEVIQQLAKDATASTLFLTGHGGLAPPAAIARQLAYLHTYREAVRDLAAGRPALTEQHKEELVRRVTDFEPARLLAFLIPAGADPVARELATST